MRIRDRIKTHLVKQLLPGLHCGKLVPVVGVSAMASATSTIAGHCGHDQVLVHPFGAFQ